MMKSLVYMSSVVTVMTPKELGLIFDVSRERNAKNDITGVLIYSDGSFLQVLEGPVSNVDDIFKSIKADSRNKDVVLMNEEVGLKREFKAWSMCFEGSREMGFNDEFISIKDLKELFENPGNSRAKSMLKSFYDMRMN